MRTRFATVPINLLIEMVKSSKNGGKSDLSEAKAVLKAIDLVRKKNKGK